ncbi:MAG TPA: hypothetical protein VFW02_08585, partial [Candidatus Limnocylindrales bacterium]|nr:hypothetical protein [Candidatus Limnocylindrales bacterium]
GDAHTCTVDWGDGSSPTTVSGSAGSCSATHPYLDDNPTATLSDANTVTVTVTDDAASTGGSGTLSDMDTTPITVKNVAPVITSVTGPIGPIALGGSAMVVSNFTDIGSQDTHTCKFEWDDTMSTTVVAAGTGNGSCSATHTYGTAGVYTVKVTATDDDTGLATSKFEFVVVYDPSAGFVTGGGWINVAAGSCQLTTVCGGATGKANFGFNSKYKKGASVPDGQTEFQFQAGNLNFHSEAYEWLVINGFKAQYRGTGEINGTTGYSFILTAYDGNANGGGGVDKFRIKIWRTSTGTVVFDSKMGYSDDIDAANPQAIAGGSIVIHK